MVHVVTRVHDDCFSVAGILQALILIFAVIYLYSLKEVFAVLKHQAENCIKSQCIVLDSQEVLFFQ